MRWPPRKVLWRLLQLGLLLILLGSLMLFVPRSNVVMRSRSIIVHALCKDVTAGIKNFQVEYHRYPAPLDALPNDDLNIETEGPLLDCLLGADVWGNKRRVVYMEPPVAKSGRAGLEGAPSHYRLLDSWGNTFRVTMDTNRDNKVANPDARNADPEIQTGAPAMLPTSVIVFSCGPDGRPFTADDIPSWRPSPPIGPTLAEVVLQPDVLLFFTGISLVLYSIVGLFATAGRTSSP